MCLCAGDVQVVGAAVPGRDLADANPARARAGAGGGATAAIGAGGGCTTGAAAGAGATTGAGGGVVGVGGALLGSGGAGMATVEVGSAAEELLGGFTPGATRVKPKAMNNPNAATIDHREILIQRFTMFPRRRLRRLLSAP